MAAAQHIVGIPRGERQRLKIELEKEEALLKNVKEKLLDQLQRLKVEELALQKYISLSNNTQSQQTTSTGSYFTNQVNPSTGSETNQNNQINHIPLTGLNDSLTSNSLMLNTGQYEEEEDEDD